MHILIITSLITFFFAQINFPLDNSTYQNSESYSKKHTINIEKIINPNKKIIILTINPLDVANPLHYSAIRQYVKKLSVPKDHLLRFRIPCPVGNCESAYRSSRLSGARWRTKQHTQDMHNTCLHGTQNQPIRNCVCNHSTMDKQHNLNLLKSMSINVVVNSIDTQKVYDTPTSIQYPNKESIHSSAQRTLMHSKELLKKQPDNRGKTRLFYPKALKLISNTLKFTIIAQFGLHKHLIPEIMPQIDSTTIYITQGKAINNLPVYRISPYDIVDLKKYYSIRDNLKKYNLDKYLCATKCPIGACRYEKVGNSIYLTRSTILQHCFKTHKTCIHKKEKCDICQKNVRSQNPYTYLRNFDVYVVPLKHK